MSSEFTILIFSVPAGTEFCEAAVKWKSVADFYPQGVRGIRKAAKLPTAAQDCRARQQINLNRFLARPVRAKKLFSLRKRARLWRVRCGGAHPFQMRDNVTHLRRSQTVYTASY